MEVKSNAVKSNIAQELECRYMVIGKLEVAKHEMARMNIDILGISELKWNEQLNLTQMTITSTAVGKNPLEEMEQLSQSTESKMQYLNAISKTTE